MTTTEGIEVFRRVIDAGFNSGNLEELDRWVAPDLIEHQLGGESGLPALKEMIRGLRTAFPDLRMTIEDSVTAGDKVWARLTCRGTQTGPLMGLPATRRAMETTPFEICRFANGKLVEHWGVPDRFAGLAQLGLLPPAGRPALPAR